MLLIVLLSTFRALVLSFLGFGAHTPRPPHSPKLPSLANVKKVDQNLDDIWQDLDRTLAISGRLLPHKMKPRSQKTMPRN